MLNDVLKLITETKSKNELGIWQKTRTYTEVFCEVRSITRAEFFDAGRNGLNPDMSFLVFAGEYSGEALVEYDGKTYAIYRTYRDLNSDYIELYAQREGGMNGKAESHG